MNDIESEIKEAMIRQEKNRNKKYLKLLWFLAVIATILNIHN